MSVFANMPFRVEKILDIVFEKPILNIKFMMLHFRLGHLEVMGLHVFACFFQLLKASGIHDLLPPFLNRIEVIK